jgi:AcrR family transcriptional regulator
MSTEEISPKERIILAAIECINRDGIQNITTRSIAKQADVNSAAINYYFGTKDRLVDIALGRTLDEMSKMPEEILDSGELSPRLRLEAFFTAVFDGVVLWPGITKAHFYPPFLENNFDSPSVQRINAFLESITQKIKGLEMRNPQTDLKTALVQIMSAIVFPGLMPGVFDDFSRIDFKDAAARKAYVSDLIGRYFV